METATSAEAKEKNEDPIEGSSKEKSSKEETSEAPKPEAKKKTEGIGIPTKKIARIILNKEFDSFSPFPEHLRDDSSRTVGSEFKKDEKGKSTMDVIRGLDPIQEKILLPEIIGVPHDHANFLKASKDFWVSYKVKPSPEPGKSLDYTTVKDTVMLKDKEVEYDKPLNTYDYMSYMFCRQSSKVAKTPEEHKNKGLFPFILIDEAERKREEANKYQIREEADTTFALLVKGTKGEPTEEDVAKIDWVINVLRKPEEFIDLQVMTLVEKKMWLREVKDVRPGDFVNAVSDPNLEYKALKVMLVERGLLRYEGDHYYYSDRNLGKETGVVSWLKDPSNGNELRDLKMRLKDKLKQEKTQLQL